MDMKSDFFSVLTSIASTADWTVKFIIRSRDRRDRSTHKRLVFLLRSLFFKFILAGFRRLFSHLKQEAGIFAAQKD